VDDVASLLVQQGQKLVLSVWGGLDALHTTRRV